ncbi:DNA repair protein RecN [Glaciecola sp. MH2013]|uniref:DNA repair protein RecN n=1 Tax=Glaciecola sp. MH2013 TaxID=2785524 RepID=UPI00189DC2A8|nr:DNA repair protein RecN [Glaciecola sp. MH2013]MBF7072528.1 DNA repair protein RecN [Glaciecola sp. MH2013]
MLVHISVKNFAVVKQLQVDLVEGMTAITGETGAGKSIAIDALSLCLGDRADAASVRKGAEKAEIVAHFDVSHLKLAKSWLEENELEQEDNKDECFIRRLISQEGRSKAFINGVAVSLNQLKALGQYLVSIHGQNAHHQLLKTDNQRRLVDIFAEHSSLIDAVASACKALKEKQSQLSELQEAQQQRNDRKQLLSYQVAELDEFSIAENEFSELEIEHKRLSNSQTLLEQAQMSFYLLYEGDEFNALSAIRSCIDNLADMQEHDPLLGPIVEVLNEASIQVEEASQELRQYCEQLEIDPMRLQQVEQRYASSMDFARKHNVKPEALYDKHMELAAEYATLIQQENSLGELEEECLRLASDYKKHAEALHLSRQKSATLLAKKIEAHIRDMNMPHAKVEIEVNSILDAKPSAHGTDQVSIKVATNPGQAADSLDKVVSGGELSRIGLAIQVITASGNHIPTMIFDEVDTGISGPTASIVGRLLRKLGERSQVMCVTHLPQVAAHGHNQIFVTKLTDGDSTETRMLQLTENERVNEIARLLAGDKLTDTAIANARDLLKL